MKAGTALVATQRRVRMSGKGATRPTSLQHLCIAAEADALAASARAASRRVSRRHASYSAFSTTSICMLGLRADCEAKNGGRRGLSPR
eukprot:5509958-Pleurochrysis_carterae.AAC.2